MKARLIRLRPWSGLMLLGLIMGIFVFMEVGRIGNEYWEAVEAGWPDIPSYSKILEPYPKWQATGMLRCRDGWLEQEMVNRMWGVVPRHDWISVWAPESVSSAHRLPCPELRWQSN